MPFAQLADVRLHYRIDGADDAPPLLLANSLGTTADMWEPQMPALAGRFRVIRHDTRGHGLSQVTPGPYSIEQLGRDALGLLDRLGIARAHFCGLSMGGMVGIFLGIHAPERVDRLVLSNTAAKIGTPEMWNARIEALRKDGTAGIAAGLMERWFTPAFRASAAPTVEAMRNKVANSSTPGYIACCEAIRDHDERTSIADIRVPTLVIAGTQDVATPPADGRFLADHIPGARYVEFDTAHLSNVEQPQAFSKAVLEFLNEAR